MNYKEIPLHNSNLKIKVSIDDYEVYCHAKWFLSNNGYATAYICSEYQKIHRLVVGIFGQTKMVVDHINMDKLDNRRENLRVCSRGKNNQNTGPRKGNKLGVKGVRPRYGGFSARISFNNKQIYLGSYKTLEEAADAYDDAAKKYFGDYAKLNNLKKENQ